MVGDNTIRYSGFIPLQLMAIMLLIGSLNNCTPTISLAQDPYALDVNHAYERSYEQAIDSQNYRYFHGSNSIKNIRGWFY